MIEQLNISELPSLPFSERSSLPMVRALYVASSASGDVLYVGATCSLRSRMKSHHRRFQFESIGDVSISWIEVVEDVVPRKLRRMEQDLIEQLKPSLNSNSVPLMADQLVQIAALVSSDTKRAIDHLAEKESRTVSKIVKRLLEQALKANEVSRETKGTVVSATVPGNR